MTTAFSVFNADTLAQGLAAHGCAALTYIDRANPDRPVVLNTYRPLGYVPGNPVVLVQHGVMRNGDDYRDFWIPAADKHGLLIVAPTFSDADWPGSHSYNNGRVREHDALIDAPPEASQSDATGPVRPVGDWTYAILARIWADLRTSGVVTRAQAHLFGHSAGGQFVHRLMSSQSHAPFEAVMASNSGWYTLPDLALPFPEGMRIDGLDHGHLVRLLAYPLTLLLGRGDNAIDAPNLPANPEAMRQGPYRHRRGHNYFERGRAAAERLGVPFNWTLIDVDHIGHNGDAMSLVAASLWFDDVLPDSDALACLAAGQVA